MSDKKGVPANRGARGKRPGRPAKRSGEAAAAVAGVPRGGSAPRRGGRGGRGGHVPAPAQVEAAALPESPSAQADEVAVSRPVGFNTDEWMNLFQYQGDTPMTPAKCAVARELGIRRYVEVKDTVVNPHALSAALRIESEVTIWNHVRGRWRGGAWVSQGRKQYSLILVGHGSRQRTDFVPPLVKLVAIAPVDSAGNVGPDPKDHSRSERSNWGWALGDLNAYWATVEAALLEAVSGSVCIFYNTIYYAPKSTQEAIRRAHRNGVYVYATVMGFPAPGKEGWERAQYVPDLPKQIANWHRFVEGVSVRRGENWEVTLVGGGQPYVHPPPMPGFVPIQRVTGGMWGCIYGGATAEADPIYTSGDALCFDVMGDCVWFPNTTQCVKDTPDETSKLIAAALRTYYGNSQGMVAECKPPLLSAPESFDSVARLIADQCCVSRGAYAEFVDWSRSIGTRDLQYYRRVFPGQTLVWLLFGMLTSVLGLPVLLVGGRGKARAAALSGVVTSLCLMAYDFLAFGGLDALPVWNLCTLAANVLVLTATHYPNTLNDPFYRSATLRRGIYFLYFLLVLWAVNDNLGGMRAPLDRVTRSFVVVEGVGVAWPEVFGQLGEPYNPCADLLACVQKESESSVGFLRYRSGVVTGYQPNISSMFHRETVFQWFVTLVSNWISLFLARFELAFFWTRLALIVVFPILAALDNWMWALLWLMAALATIPMPHRGLKVAVKRVAWLPFLSYLSGYWSVLSLPFLAYDILTLTTREFTFDVIERGSVRWGATGFPWIGLLLQLVHVAALASVSIGAPMKRCIGPFFPKVVPGIVAGKYESIVGICKRVLNVRKTIEHGVALSKRTGLPKVGGIAVLTNETCVPPHLVYQDATENALLCRAVEVVAPAEDEEVFRQFKAFVTPFLDKAMANVSAEEATEYLKRMATEFTGNKREQYETAARILSTEMGVPFEAATYLGLLRRKAPAVMTAFTKLELGSVRGPNLPEFESVDDPEAMARFVLSAVGSRFKPRAVCFPKAGDLSEIDALLGIFAQHAFIKEMLRQMWDNPFVICTSVDLLELATQVEARLPSLDPLPVRHSDVVARLLRVYRGLGHNPELADSGAHLLGATFCSKVLMLAKRAGKPVLSFCVPFDRLVSRAMCLSGDHGVRFEPVLLAKLDSLLLLCQGSRLCTRFLRICLKYVERITLARREPVSSHFTPLTCPEGAYEPHESEDDFWEAYLGVPTTVLDLELNALEQNLSRLENDERFDVVYQRKSRLQSCVVDSNVMPNLARYLAPGYSRPANRVGAAAFVNLAADALRGERAFEFKRELERLRGGQPAMVCLKPGFPLEENRGTVKVHQLVRVASRLVNKRGAGVLFRGSGRPETYAARFSAADVPFVVVSDFPSYGETVYDYRKVRVYYDNPHPWVLHGTPSARWQPGAKLAIPDDKQLWVIHPHDWDHFVAEVQVRLADAKDEFMTCWPTSWLYLSDVQTKNKGGLNIGEVVEGYQAFLAANWPIAHTFRYLIKRSTVDAFVDWCWQSNDGLHLLQDITSEADFDFEERWEQDGMAPVHLRLFGHRWGVNVPGSESYLFGSQPIRVAAQGEEHFQLLDSSGLAFGDRLVAYDVANAEDLCPPELGAHSADTLPAASWVRTLVLSNSGVTGARARYEAIANKAGRSDLNRYWCTETDAASCDGSHQRGNGWLQDELINLVSAKFPTIDPVAVRAIVFGPAVLDNGSRAYLADSGDQTAALYSGLPSTTFVNSVRFVFAFCMALASLMQTTPAQALTGGRGLILSTGDDFLGVSVHFGESDPALAGSL